jgi:MYXO-CTERM domain-containing protein
LRVLAFALALFSVAAVSRSASAFCRTTTNENFVPTTAKPCDDTGKPIAWASKCVGFSMQKNASVQIDLAKATSLAEAAFAEWAAHDCGACGAAGKPSIVAQDLGPVSCGDVEYVQKDGGNANVVVFRDGTWPHESVALALTTVTFSVATGEIYDADMEVQSNPTEVKLAISDPVPANGYDLKSILTHEAGHFLGLAHTQLSNKDATMFPSYDRGQTFMRDLSQDDVCGICAAYPPTRAAACDSSPRGGLSDACGGNPKSGCGCSVPGTSGSLQHAGAAFALAAFAIGVTRRRRVHRPTRLL